MSKESTFRIMKMVIHDFVDDNGNFRPIVIGSSAQILETADKNREEEIRTFIKILLQTDLISYESKEYLKDQYLSVEKVWEKICESGYYGKVPLNKNTAITRVQRDQIKVQAEFGNDIATNLLRPMIPSGQYVYKMMQYLSRTNSNKVRENLVLNIDESSFNSYLTEVDFDDLMTMIKPYTRSYVKDIESLIDDKKAGYFNYILNCPDSMLKEVDKDRKKQLLEILS
ncbi:MAG: hypothetical protein IJ593_04735 [Lachnospiraceae bacterium]|nr:hypothetical protein [Lachnospiraceae bacterium]